MDGFCDADENPFGPVHEYVAPDTAGVDKLIAEPLQTGELLDATGVAGIGFTTTLVVPCEEEQPATETLIVYIPELAGTAFAMIGFCNVELNPLGPVQLYDPPATEGVVRLIGPFSHTGELLLAVGVAGIGMITTLVEAVAPEQPATVAYTE